MPTILARASHTAHSYRTVIGYARMVAPALCRHCRQPLDLPKGPGRPPQFHAGCRDAARKQYWTDRRTAEKARKREAAAHEAAIRTMFSSVHVTDRGQVDWSPLVQLLATPEGRVASRDVVSWALKTAWERQQATSDASEAVRLKHYRLAAKTLLEALP